MSGMISGMGARLALQSGAAQVGTSTSTPFAVPYLQTLSDIVNGLPVSAARFVSPAVLAAVRAGTYGGDTTAALASAVNSGAKTVFVPSGRWNFTTFNMPGVANFRFTGEGEGSVLVQQGAGIKYPALAHNCLDAHGAITSLAFDGTNGTGNTLDTTFAQTLKLKDLFFTNVPVGLTSLKVDGNPNDGTYAHDVLMEDIRIYSTTAGNAGIALGSYHSDSKIKGFEMEGNFQTNFCLYAAPGASTTRVSDAHPYNAKQNVVRLDGNNTSFRWTDCTFDNALGDTFYQKGSVNGRFVNCWWESTNAGQHAITFDNSYNNTIVGGGFQSPFGVAAACVQELNGASGNKVIGGDIDNPANWANLWNINGEGSWAKGFQQYAPEDENFCLVGIGQAAQAQGTAADYGHGGMGKAGNVAWPFLRPTWIRKAVVELDSAIPAGQSGTANLKVNNTTIASAQLNPGSAECVLLPAPPYAANRGDVAYIEVVLSSGAGSKTVRCGLICSA
ncbi:hypothetical protein [Burkholderia gladioli]|uniref:hypothetical protein n=1 Tax=Burkholderia gladioli TaxID=28095 RepID=UPI00163F9AB6|nr:hypothetical protein [Burkholderia gladioli]